MKDNKIAKAWFWEARFVQTLSTTTFFWTSCYSSKQYNTELYEGGFFCLVLLCFFVLFCCAIKSIYTKHSLQTGLRYFMETWVSRSPAGGPNSLGHCPWWQIPCPISIHCSLRDLGEASPHTQPSPASSVVTRDLAPPTPGGVSEPYQPPPEAQTLLHLGGRVTTTKRYRPHLHQLEEDMGKQQCKNTFNNLKSNVAPP